MSAIVFNKSDVYITVHTNSIIVSNVGRSHCLLYVEKKSEGYSEYFNGDVRDVIVALGKEGAFDKIASFTESGAPTGKWTLIADERVTVDEKYDELFDNVEKYLDKLYCAKEYPAGPLKTDTGVLVTYNTVSHCQYFFEVIDEKMCAMFNGQPVTINKYYPLSNLDNLASYVVNMNISSVNSSVNSSVSFKDLVYLNKVLPTDENQCTDFHQCTQMSSTNFYKEYIRLIDALRSIRDVKDFSHLIESRIPINIQAIKNEAKALSEAGADIGDIGEVMKMLDSEISKIEDTFSKMVADIINNGKTSINFANVTLQAYTDVSTGKVNVYTVTDNPVIISTDYYTNHELLA
jgi:hypothetical protein